MNAYLNDWAEGGEAEMLEDFGIEKAALDGAEVLVASYTYENCSGNAFVLFRRGGELWEVNGSHCSCHGLESSDVMGDPPSQWEPEPTTPDSLLARMDRRWGFDPGVADAIRLALAEDVK